MKSLMYVLVSATMCPHYTHIFRAGWTQIPHLNHFKIVQLEAMSSVELIYFDVQVGKVKSMTVASPLTTG